MSKVNENGFESDEEEQFYLNKLREQAKEEDAMEEMRYVFFLEDQCISKDQRIAELEKQLENAIVPKFKIGKLVWVIGFIENEYGVFEEPLQKVVTGIMQRINDFIYDIHGEIYLEKDIFATKEEAEKALKELE